MRPNFHDPPSCCSCCNEHCAYRGRRFATADGCSRPCGRWRRAWDARPTWVRGFTPLLGRRGLAGPAASLKMLRTHPGAADPMACLEAAQSSRRPVVRDRWPATHWRMCVASCHMPTAGSSRRSDRRQHTAPSSAGRPVDAVKTEGAVLRLEHRCACRRRHDCGRSDPRHRWRYLTRHRGCRLRYDRGLRGGWRAWCAGRRSPEEDRRRVSPTAAILRSRSYRQAGAGDRAAAMEKGDGLPSAGARGERLLPVQVHHRRGLSRAEFSRAGG